MTRIRSWTITVGAFGGEDVIDFTLRAYDAIDAVRVAAGAYEAATGRKPATIDVAEPV